MVDVAHFKSIFPFLQDLNQEDIFNFLSHCQLMNFEQSEIILAPGSRKSKIYFVESGLIRSYYTNEKGEEITNRIRYENQVMACYEINLLNEPSRYTLQTIEITQLLVIDFDILNQLVHGHPKYEAGLRYFLKDSLLQSLQLLDDFMLLSPEERYLKFLKDHPELIKRIPNKYIANVLGITPVSLSRIRKRIARKMH